MGAFQNTLSKTSISKTSLITKTSRFLETAPPFMVAATKVHMNITLETIYEEDETEEALATSAPSSTSFLKVPSSTCSRRIPPLLPSFGHNCRCA
ncbi:hypothetical protein L6164_033448 [Bauhinia variegata]|uniref:Uncharacterized protein n=1 Tax=Bauhinia variegata TaxID=167791 RepID=A0ACB9KRY7_BAUVA|nr:hypothetical protein L6164_033448 [Bauhinia variegata]